MLTQLIGKGRAMDLILTGRRLEVQEAFDIGIVNRIVPQGQAITEAVKLANQIASQPQESLVHDKMMIHKVVNENLTRDEVMSTEYISAAIQIVKKSLKKFGL